MELHGLQVFLTFQTLFQILNVSLLRQVLGKKAFFVTMIRSPVTQFESSFYYYNLQGYYHMTLQQYVERYVMILMTTTKKDKEILRAAYDATFASRRFNNFRGLNQQIYDMGYPDKTQFGNDTQIKSHIEELDQQFDLVLIMERFEESLAVLADMLCLQTESLVYIPSMQRDTTMRVSGHWAMFNLILLL